MHKFTKHFMLLESEKNNIIGNKYQGTFVKISKECYQILKELLKNECSEEEFVDIFESEEDKVYFLKLYEILQAKKILVDIEDKEYIKDVDIQWELTNECNLSCIHCIASAEKPKAKAYDYDYMLKVADQIIELSPNSLTISGGEPMILPFFFDLSEYIKERYNGLLVLMTNGTFITEKNVDRIAQIYGNVSISVDGVDEETCSMIRGEGVFNKVIKSVHLLKNAGVDKISLSMVLTNENKKYEQEFYDLCDELKVKACVRVFAPVGRGKKHKELFVSSKPEVTQDNYIPEDVLLKKKNNQPIEEFGVCGAEFGSFTIGFEGDIFLCAPFEYEGKSLGKIDDIGNLNQFIKLEKFKETQAYKDFEKTLPANKEKCRECDVRYFCWHCPFMNEQALMNDKGYWIDCEKKKRDLKFSLWGEQ